MTGDGNDRIERETPVNPYTIIEAVNASSEAVNRGWLIFLAIMAYVLITVAGVTHKDILLEAPVALPILQVAIPLKLFFIFAPIILVLFHLGIVAQLVLLANKTIEFDQAVRLLESNDQRTHPLRLELHNFFFTQAVAGPGRSRVISAFLHGMSWLTTMIFPVLLLVYIQLSFLPYHDVTATWVQRLTLVFDLVVLLLIGTFLLRTETSFFDAMTRNARAHPFNVAFTSMFLLFAAVVAFFAATVPGELLDRTAEAAFGSQTPKPGLDRRSKSGALMRQSGVAVFGVFHRNLVVTDADLVSDRDVEPGEATLNLRGRDLRYARLDRSDLHQADLTGADLTGASLIAADLRQIAFTCADLAALKLNGNRVAAGCSKAESGNFSRARLDGATMAGADLRSANLTDASITDGRFSQAVMTGADFSGARLDKADLAGGVRAEGASFVKASLAGADLSDAQLQGADFTAANLRAALLNAAHLDGAMLRETNLEGASLARAYLSGADLAGSKTTAADFRGAVVTMAVPPSSDPAGLADFRDVQVRALDQSELSALTKVIQRLAADPNAGVRVAEKLRPLSVDQPAVSSSATEAANSAWRALVSASLYGDDAGRQKITDHLATLMCRSRSDGDAVATGVVRRAQTEGFAGFAVNIYDAARRDDCPSGKSVAPALLLGLAIAAEVPAAN